MEDILAAEVRKLIDNHQINSNHSKYNRLFISDKNVVEHLFLMEKKYRFSITFENCTFISFTIDSVSFDFGITFTNCKFVEDINFHSIDLYSIRFENCQTLGSIVFVNCNIGVLTLEKTESIKGITFKSGSFINLEINPLNERTHLIFEGKFLLIKNLIIQCSSGITVFSKNCIINSIYLSGYFNSTSRIDFNNIYNNKIEINSVNNDGKFYISNLQNIQIRGFSDKLISDYIEDFQNSTSYVYRERDIETINHLSNDDQKVLDFLSRDYPVDDFPHYVENKIYTDFLVYLEHKNPQLTIINSSLGHLEFKSIDLGKFELNLHSSDLSSMKLINSTIPIIKTFKNYLNYYSIYNDLYTSASRQNNTKDKIEYYKASQRFLLNYLRNEAPKGTREGGSRWAIIISLIFSNHGTNWVQALWVTLAFSFAAFCFFLSSLNYINLDLSYNGIINLLNLTLQYFPQFLNPIHKVDFMDEISPLGIYSSMVDLFSRLILSIGIFEIIRSFRKHVRQ